HRIERTSEGSLVRSGERAAQLLRQRCPELGGIDRQHLVLSDRDEAPFRQLLAESRWNRQPSFLVHADPMGSRKHSSGLPELALETLLARAQPAAATVQL